MSTWVHPRYFSSFRVPYISSLMLWCSGTVSSSCCTCGTVLLLLNDTSMILNVGCLCLFVFILCTSSCRFLWIVHSWLHLQFLLTLNVKTGHCLPSMSTCVHFWCGLWSLPSMSTCVHLWCGPWSLASMSTCVHLWCDPWSLASMSTCVHLWCGPWSLDPTSTCVHLWCGPWSLASMSKCVHLWCGSWSLRSISIGVHLRCGPWSSSLFCFLCLVFWGFFFFVLCLFPNIACISGLFILDCLIGIFFVFVLCPVSCVSCVSGFYILRFLLSSLCVLCPMLTLSLDCSLWIPFSEFFCRLSLSCAKYSLCIWIVH